MKRIKSICYTKGHYSGRPRKATDTDSEYLYAMGIYPTKIKREDLPKDYIEFKSRAIWYMTGYLKTSNIQDVYYISIKENHLFKDDYLYISYNDKLKIVKTDYGTEICNNYDFRVCGGDIIPILFEIERNSKVDTSRARSGIIEKFEWWKRNEIDDYRRNFNGKEIDDIFEYYQNKK